MEDTQFLMVLILALTAAGAFWSAYASQQSADIAREATKASEIRSRQLETMKLINETEASPRFLELTETFRKRREAGTLRDLHGSIDDAARADRHKVMGLLNHYELLSLSIQTGLIDEQVYRNWMETAFVRDWNAAASLIEAERWSSAPTVKSAAAERPEVVSRPVHASTRLDAPVVADPAPAAASGEAMDDGAADDGASGETGRHYNPRVFEAFEALALRWDPSAKRIDGPV